MTPATRRKGIPTAIRHRSRALERLAQLLQVDEDALIGDNSGI